jgi:hypothetical protein
MARLVRECMSIRSSYLLVIKVFSLSNLILIRNQCMAESHHDAKAVHLPPDRHLQMILGLHNDWIAAEVNSRGLMRTYMESLQCTCQRPSQTAAWIQKLSREARRVLQNKDGRAVLPVVRRSYLAAVLLCQRQLSSRWNSTNLLNDPELLKAVSR